MFPQNQYTSPTPFPNNSHIGQNLYENALTPDGDQPPIDEKLNNRLILDQIFNTKNKLNTIIFGNINEKIKSSQEIGYIFQQQKGIMLDLQKRKKERENKRKKREIILFFNHNGDILPLEFNANKSIEDVLKKYIDMTQLKNVKFKYKNIELLENDSNHLLNEFECKGLVTGSEILVEDKV